MANFEAWLANNKALWTRVYDEVIVPDLEKEWKKRTETHEAESKQKDEHLQILTTHVSNDVVKYAKLQEENIRLRKLLLKQSGGNMPSTEELASNTDDATIPIEEYHKVTEKLDDLNKRYQDATQRIKYLERKNAAVMQKNKDMKESVKAWQEYCDRHIDKKNAKSEGTSTKSPSSLIPGFETPEIGPTSSPALPAMRTPQWLITHERSSPAPVAEPSYTATRSHTSDAAVLHENVQTEDVCSIPEEHHAPENRAEHSSPSLIVDVENSREVMTASVNNDRVAFLGHASSDKLASSQTTVPEVVERDHETSTHTAKPAEDDDEPEFVFERSLKRKRNPSTGLRVHQDGSSDGTPAKPVRVKEELHSSPPPEPAVNKLMRKETIDLDELGSNIITTPRRRRMRRVNSIHSTETGTLRNQRSSSAPFRGNATKPEPTDEVNVVDAEPGSYLAVRMEDERAVSEPSLEPSNVLQPLDPNVVAGRLSEATPNKRIRREAARKVTEFNILAESGEGPPPIDERKIRLPPNLARAHFNQRIRAAKNGLSPMKNAFTTPKTAPAKTIAADNSTSPSASHHFPYTPSARPVQRKAPATVPRGELIPDGRRVWRMGATPPIRTAPTPAREPSPQVPLREKPLSELRIHDFKPNPRYNKGYTHAFTETVRSRADRLCLPGCTNPACCGSTFRTLAQAAAALSSSQEEDLLKEYLGDAYDSFGLTQMSREERDEIVLQARTRKMAMEHGKHRRAWEGRRTPPGFWRVDFPSTQERDEDREKAAQMEQAEVRERWLEAQRQGGRWTFRDE